MHRYIWLVPLLPLLGAAVNGLLGGRLRFSERLVGSIAVGSVALAFLISLLAVWSYGFGGDARWPKPYLTSEDGAFSYTWIPGGATKITQGRAERDRAALEGKTAEAIKSGEAPRGQFFAVNVEPERPGRGSVLNVEWSYQLDPLSSIFMLIVTGVGLCIFVFATGYMHGDAGFYRFF